ncbi:MJ0144 family RNA dihydrouridine synthase-like protein [Methanobrevibacter filiformis]|nr:MJ0144 family RNA dihydrouridine synthase-like protein [Methanobrevibacter filiformis]
MAGVCDSEFINRIIPFGFDMVTLGGYNTDKETIEAGKKILQRGRKEFDIKEEELINHIQEEVEVIKSKYDVLVSANLRSTTPDPIIEISKIKNLDVIEINCHCRQKEMLDISCGQALLKNIEFLENYLKEIRKKVKKKISVKIRANVENVDTIAISKLIDELRYDYLHIDSMKPGFPYADLDLIKKIAIETGIYIIGNNSIINIESANKMINAGASGISIGRVAMHKNINFDLKAIKTIY